MGATSKPSGRAAAAREPLLEMRAVHSAKRSGEKKMGSQPSAISAASATFFGPIAAR